MMKMEFNTNGFSATMRDNNEEHSSQSNSFPNLIKDKKSFLLGLAAIVISVFNLPFGLFMNFSTRLLEVILETGLMHWIIVLCVFSVLMIAVAILCGVLSIVSYTKSEKTSVDMLGLVLSIFSFAVGAVCLVLNIIGITVW